MIIHALAEYYDYLLKEKPNQIARPGWCSRNVSAMLEIDSDGNLVGVIPAEEKNGWARNVPDQEKRSSGVSANFLCDTSSYFFGLDEKGNLERAVRCFEASKAKHLELLASCDSAASKAVKLFFENWNPLEAANNEIIKAYPNVLNGRNLVFRYNGKEVLEDSQIMTLIECAKYDASKSEDKMTCLVTGRKSVIARLHPNIKGVYGSQSGGAALVGFNSRSFESYGHDEEQGRNAPVGQNVVFAYTTALNYLLSQRSHCVRIGDTTMVYWAAANDEELSGDFANLFAPGLFGVQDNQEDADYELDGVMKKIAQARALNRPEINTKFYILGLAPNAARLSVRFFVQGSFADLVSNIENHYKRLQVVHAPFQKEYLSPHSLIKACENPNAKTQAVSGLLAGTLVRSILNDLPYPKAMYENILLRLRATQNNEEKHQMKVTYERVAFIKAYLIKNAGLSEEEITVDLNTERRTPAYCLGRLFAILEATQERSSGNTNSTIFGKYFNSACATPGVVFPVIMKLNTAHLEKLRKTDSGYSVHYSRLIGELVEAAGEFPKTLTIEEQGEFIIGYWCQRQERFKKVSSNENSAE